MKVTLDERSNKKEIDWSKRQMIVSKEGVVVLIEENINANRFSGVVLYEKSFKYGIGYFDRNWLKEYFEPFNGKISLENS